MASLNAVAMQLLTVDHFYMHFVSNLLSLLRLTIIDELDDKNRHCFANLIKSVPDWKVFMVFFANSVEGCNAHKYYSLYFVPSYWEKSEHNLLISWCTFFAGNSLEKEAWIKKQRSST